MEKGELIASPQPESFQARAAAFWLARQTLIEQLTKEGKLNPRATDLPHDLMLELLEQFGLLDALGQPTEDVVNGLLRESSANFASNRKF